VNRPNRGRSGHVGKIALIGDRFVPCGCKVDDDQHIFRCLHEDKEVVHIVYLSDHDDVAVAIDEIVREDFFGVLLRCVFTQESGVR